MSLSKIDEFLFISNDEIYKSILQTEQEIFNLRFKKATRQSFKSSNFKIKKRKLAQLKTILSYRLKLSEKNSNIAFKTLIK